MVDVLQIVSMERGETSNSKSPMWRCITADNQRVNVFQHQDANKNSFRYFEAAGYGPEMLAMEVGQTLTWKNSPVSIFATKNGQWNEIIGCTPRPTDAQPDPQFPPNAALYRLTAGDQARALLYNPDVVIWDTETTGLTEDDEIISVALVGIDGSEYFKSLIQPVNMQRAADTVEITGITPDELASAPMFHHVWHQINSQLSNAIWCGWNIDFDAQMLDRACRRTEHPPIFPLATVDAMRIFANFYGELKPGSVKFSDKKLTFAAEHLGIDFTEAHDAARDAHMTLEVIQAIARWQPAAEVADIPY